MPGPRLGLAGGLAHATVDSKLTPLLILGSLALGAFATVLLPREEEPQIIVPMVDVMVQMPGASAAEVEDRVTRPMEQLLWEIPGVEYVYSISQPDQGMCIVRYKVGTNEENALVRIYNKLFSHYDLIPPGASEPIIKFRSIDDVPVLALTFHSSHYNPQALRHYVAQVQAQVKEIADVSQTMITGGLRREFRVEVDPLRLAAYALQPSDVVAAVQSANQEAPTGYSDSSHVLRTRVRAGSRIRTTDDLRRVTCKSPAGQTVFLGELGTILDGPEDRQSYVETAAKAGGEHAEGQAATLDAGGFEEGVTLAIAKRKGTNATVLCQRILDKVEALRGGAFPSDLSYMVTRDYGETAKEKSDELLKHLLIATLSVALLIAIALGWRESGVVLVAVPVTLALTLLVFLLMGFTLNRITLFALIFSIGILVDDAIVVVENIVRHMHLPESHGKTRAEIAIAAVAEVGNPTILATFTVIAAILPMAFVRVVSSIFCTLVRAVSLLAL